MRNQKICNFEEWKIKIVLKRTVLDIFHNLGITDVSDQDISVVVDSDDVFIDIEMLGLESYTIKMSENTYSNSVTVAVIADGDVISVEEGTMKDFSMIDTVVFIINHFMSRSI